MSFGWILPVELIAATHMHKLQQKLNLAGQSIPLVPIDVNGNLAAKAKVSASSELSLSEIPFDGPWYTLDYSTAQLLPLEPGIPYKFEVEVDASRGNKSHSRITLCGERLKTIRRI
mgnify:CR=1 FL=1